MQLPGQLLKHQNTVSRQSADKVREIPTGKPASNTAFDCYFVRNDLDLELSFVEKDVGLA